MPQTSKKRTKPPPPTKNTKKQEPTKHDIIIIQLKVKLSIYVVTKKP